MYFPVTDLKTYHILIQCLFFITYSNMCFGYRTLHIGLGVFKSYEFIIKNLSHWTWQVLLHLCVIFPTFKHR